MVVVAVVASARDLTSAAGRQRQYVHAAVVMHNVVGRTTSRASRPHVLSEVP